jgi:hypothetical protein
MKFSWKKPATVSVLAVLVFCSFSLPSAEAAPAKSWNYDSTGSGTCILEASNGGYLVAVGYRGTFLLIKINATGGFEWNQTCGGPNGNWAMPHSIIQTNDDGFALAGVGGNFNFVKIDQAGNTQWKQLYSKLDAGAFWVYSVLQTSDGGYMLAGINDGGYTQGNYENATVSDWVVKIDQNGTMLWGKTYNVAATRLDEVSLAKAVGGGFLVGGNLGSAKIDEDGNIVWQKSSLKGQFISVKDGGYLFWATSSVIGAYPLSTVNGYLTKIDAAGNVEWKRTYQRVGNEEGVTFEGAAQTRDGGFVICGQCNWYDPGGNFPKGFGCAHVTKVNGDGEVEWSVTYNAIGPPMPSQQYFIYDVVETNGGYVFVGSRRTYLWVAKINDDFTEPVSTPKPSPTPTVASLTVMPTPTQSPNQSTNMRGPDSSVILPSSSSSTEVPTETPNTLSPSPAQAGAPDSVQPLEWTYIVGIGLAPVIAGAIAFVVWRFRKRRN